jgi:hypothetical protein
MIKHRRAEVPRWKGEMEEIKDPFLMFVLVVGLIVAPTLLIWGLVRLSRSQRRNQGER